DTISGEVEKMEQITSEFLALAKTHVENRIEVSALTLVEDVINLMSAQSDAKSIDISVEVGHYDMTMMCDEAKIKQVLINVIKNAIEAMDQGTIRIVMRDATDFIHIYVIDNGPGMSDEVVYQLGRSEERRVG